MSLVSGSLLIGTGAIHSVLGLCIPELRQPFFRGLRDGFSDKLAIEERYAREAGFWFQLAGVFMVMQGFLMRSYTIHTQGKPSPSWLGWSLTALGAGGVSVMPVSGFWLILPQGLYILALNRKQKAS